MGCPKARVLTAPSVQSVCGGLHFSPSPQAFGAGVAPLLRVLSTGSSSERVDAALVLYRLSCGVAGVGALDGALFLREGGMRALVAELKTVEIKLSSQRARDVGRDPLSVEFTSHTLRALIKLFQADRLLREAFIQLGGVQLIVGFLTTAVIATGSAKDARDNTGSFRRAKQAAINAALERASSSEANAAALAAASPRTARPAAAAGVGVSVEALCVSAMLALAADEPPEQPALLDFARHGGSRSVAGLLVRQCRQQRAARRAAGGGGGDDGAVLASVLSDTLTLTSLLAYQACAAEQLLQQAGVVQALVALVRAHGQACGQAAGGGEARLLLGAAMCISAIATFRENRAVLREHDALQALVSWQPPSSLVPPELEAGAEAARDSQRVGSVPEREGTGFGSDVACLRDAWYFLTVSIALLLDEEAGGAEAGAGAGAEQRQLHTRAVRAVKACVAGRELEHSLMQQQECHTALLAALVELCRCGLSLPCWFGVWSLACLSFRYPLVREAFIAQGAYETLHMLFFRSDLYAFEATAPGRGEDEVPAAQIPQLAALAYANVKKKEELYDPPQRRGALSFPLGPVSKKDAACELPGLGTGEASGFEWCRGEGQLSAGSLSLLEAPRVRCACPPQPISVWFGAAKRFWPMACAWVERESS